MIRLDRPLQRVCRRLKDAGRPVVVTLEPGDVLAMRPKGLRRAYRITLGECYWLAARKAAAEKRRKGWRT